MDSVLWGVAPLPQNREVLAVHAGDGSLSVHAYHYADSRWVQVQDRGMVYCVRARSIHRIDQWPQGLGVIPLSHD